MPRSKTIEVIGGTYYVILTANGRRNLILDSVDVQTLQSVVANAVYRLRISVHAFCWLAREVHLIIELNTGRLGDAIRIIAARFAKATNARRSEHGAVFSPGYYSLLIDATRYLVPLVRVVHLLPCYMGLVNHADEYQWSSHRLYLGHDDPLPWLHMQKVMDELSGGAPLLAKSAYKHLTTEPLTPKECSVFLNPGDHHALGCHFKVSRTMAVTPIVESNKDLDDLILEFSQHLGLIPAAILSRSQDRRFSRARALIAHEAIFRGIACLTEVARALNRSPSAIHLAIARHSRSTTRSEKTIFPSSAADDLVSATSGETLCQVQGQMCSVAKEILNKNEA